MNIHLLIMRETDLNKLDKVKMAALKTIVEKGYHGATISLIAKKAGVSDGYLYRHYANKNELVKSLFIESMGHYHNLFFQLIENEKDVKNVLHKSLKFLSATTVEAPEITAFIFIMDHDHNFDFPEVVKKDFVKIGQRLWAKGIQTGEINNKRNIEDVLAISFGIPVKILEMRRKGVVSKEQISEKDISNIVDMCLNALK